MSCGTIFFIRENTCARIRSHIEALGSNTRDIGVLFLPAELSLAALTLVEWMAEWGMIQPQICWTGSLFCMHHQLESQLFSFPTPADSESSAMPSMRTRTAQRHPHRLDSPAPALEAAGACWSLLEPGQSIARIHRAIRRCVLLPRVM